VGFKMRAADGFPGSLGGPVDGGGSCGCGLACKEAVAMVRELTCTTLCTRIKLLGYNCLREVPGCSRCCCGVICTRICESHRDF